MAIRHMPSYRSAKLVARLGLTGDQKRDLERLLSAGYVTPRAAHPGSPFAVTAKGMQFLGERGAGLNEA